jgi:hypothetical protein|tara:strand:- start:311 stop:520 length:210 start_codon:yes stop_codon:yes gene_type:complete
MSYLTHLKRSKHSKDSRWIVKYDKDDFVREVKLIFNPEEYRNGKRSRKLHTQKGLINILEKDKQKKTKC